MKRSKIIEIVALDIAKQAVEKGQVDADLSWLDVDRLLLVLEEAVDKALEESCRELGVAIKFDPEKMEKEIDVFFKEMENKNETK